MKLAWISSVMVAIAMTAALFAGPESFDEKRPYGRVAWFVADADGDQLLGKKVEARHGQKLIGRADANTTCELLIAAFGPDRQLLPSCPPSFVRLDAFDEQTLPAPPGIWKREAIPADAEIYAVFFHPASEHLQPLQDLLKAITSSPEKNPLLQKAQAARLRELLTNLTPRSAKPEQRSGQLPPALAGPLRGGDSDRWREMATRVNFSKEEAAVLIFRNSSATRK